MSIFEIIELKFLKLWNIYFYFLNFEKLNVEIFILIVIKDDVYLRFEYIEIF